MKKAAYFILLFLVIAGTFLAGSRYGQRSVGPGPAGARKILYYVDPMNPTHTSDKPGFAPCGMAMEPVYADGEGGPAKDAVSLSPGTVNIEPEKQQLIGVRVGRAEKAPATRVLRVLGWVTPDEERLYRLKASVDGWIEEVSPVTTGNRVEKGQLLATFSTTDLFLSSQQLVFALSSMDHLALGQESTVTIDPTRSNFQQRVERLQSLGMSSLQIEEIRKTREIPPNIRIFAPAAGFVLARSVSLGEKFEKGAEWYRIAELSQVWILADVFENEARYFQPGKTVKVTIPQQERVFQAKVSTSLPQFDPATRTLKVRLEAENPEFILKPNMYVNVELPVELPPAISVPMDAVLDTGTRKTIFVDLGDGYFEPREVETGWRFGNRVEITEGLREEERIVVSGNFLIDSESRMKLAAAGFQGTKENSAEPSREAGAEAARAPGRRNGNSSGSVEDEGRPTVAAAHEYGLMQGFAKCPVCGMLIQETKARKQGFEIEYEEVKYTFCTQQCKGLFIKSPERFAKKAALTKPEHESHARGVHRP